jgi:hypothetical protein
LRLHLFRVARKCAITDWYHDVLLVSYISHTAFILVFIEVISNDRNIISRKDERREDILRISRKSADVGASLGVSVEVTMDPPIQWESDDNPRKWADLKIRLRGSIFPTS